MTRVQPAGSNRRLDLASLLVALSLLAVSPASRAAAWTPDHRQQYEGPPRSRDQIAVVVDMNRSRGGAYDMGTSCDGQSPFFGAVVELLPGRHRCVVEFSNISVGLSAVSVRSSGGQLPLEFEALPGHVYEIYVLEQGYREGWVPAVWDVTDELSRREKAKLGREITDVLNEHRPPELQLSYPAPVTDSRPLPGFGEKRTAVITGVGGAPVTIEYPFRRYATCVRAAKGLPKTNSSDGRDYYVEVSPQTGDVVRVLGTLVSPRLKGGPGASRLAFQPLRSPLAFVFERRGTVVLREGPAGQFTRVENPTAEDMAALP